MGKLLLSLMTNPLKKFWSGVTTNISKFTTRAQPGVKPCSNQEGSPTILKRFPEPGVYVNSWVANEFDGIMLTEDQIEQLVDDDAFEIVPRVYASNFPEPIAIKNGESLKIKSSIDKDGYHIDSIELLGKWRTFMSDLGKIEISIAKIVAVGVIGFMVGAGVTWLGVFLIR